ncbi:MAG: Uma2 family endonuclease [Bacteroidota bacterium]
MEMTATASIYEIERNKPMPDKLHSYLQKRLIFLLELHYRKVYETLPELNIIFEGEKKVPDLAIYEKQALDFTKNETNITLIPVGAIEILSGQQVISNLTNKLEKYLSAGVKSYWLVLPELRSIYVFHTADESFIYGKKDVLKDEVLGIELNMKDVFEGM